MSKIGSKDQTLGSLAARESAFLAEPEIAERHGVEKRRARLRIQAKLAEYWDEYKAIPLLQKPGLIDKGKLTDAGGRAVREKVVELLRNAPLTHAFNASSMFGATWDIGDRMRNCWHLNFGSTLREGTESHLFRYGADNATPQMKTYSQGGKDSPTFSANTRPFYASLNYSNAKYGGSSGWGKTHFVLRHVLRFNATFTHADSFKVEADHKDRSYGLLANYHNVYPIINNVLAGGKDKDGADQYDILKSMIDRALALKPAPDEEFDGTRYIEAQIPGDILFARDIEKVVVATSEYAPTSAVGKNVSKFARKNNILIEFA